VQILKKKPQMDMNVEFSRTNSVCVALLLLKFFCHISLNYKRINKIVSIIFLFGFVAAEIVSLKKNEINLFLEVQHMSKHNMQYKS